MKQDNLKQILLEKENAVLTEDFDDVMMLIINKHASSKVADKKYVILMYFFFILGLVFGLILVVTFANLEFKFIGNVIIIHKLILQIPLVMVILLIFEKIYKATLVSMGKEKFSII